MFCGEKHSNGWQASNGGVVARHPLTPQPCPAHRLAGPPTHPPSPCSTLSGGADSRSHMLARHRDIMHDFQQVREGEREQERERETGSSWGSMHDSQWVAEEGGRAENA